MACRIFGVIELRRDVDMPRREGLVQCANPLADSCLTCIDFLAATDEANNHGPIFVPIETGNEELRFGLCKVLVLALPDHEGYCLILVPGTLCFIEQRDVFDRRPRSVNHTFVTK